MKSGSEIGNSNRGLDVVCQVEKSPFSTVLTRQTDQKLSETSCSGAGHTLNHPPDRRAACHHWRHQGASAPSPAACGKLSHGTTAFSLSRGSPVSLSRPYRSSMSQNPACPPHLLPPPKSTRRLNQEEAELGRYLEPHDLEAVDLNGMESGQSEKAVAVRRRP